MSFLPAILPVQVALGAVSSIARALRPNAGAGFAAAMQESLGRNFTNRWDADQNGTVAPGEFPGTPELFARWDKNADGSISAAEAQVELTQQVETRRLLAAAQRDWALHDSDRSGGLTPAEAGLPRSEFRPLDADRDGFLNRREWSTARGFVDSGIIR